jgi:hypothetical protein
MTGVKFKIGEHRKMPALEYLIFKYGRNEVDRMISEIANKKITEIKLMEM